MRLSFVLCASLFLLKGANGEIPKSTLVILYDIVQRIVADNRVNYNCTQKLENGAETLYKTLTNCLAEGKKPDEELQIKLAWENYKHKLEIGAIDVYFGGAARFVHRSAEDVRHNTVVGGLVAQIVQDRSDPRKIVKVTYMCSKDKLEGVLDGLEVDLGKVKNCLYDMV